MTTTTTSVDSTIIYVHLIAGESYDDSSTVSNSLSEHQFDQFSSSNLENNHSDSQKQRKQVRFSFDDEDCVTAFFSIGSTTTGNGVLKNTSIGSTSTSRANTISSSSSVPILRNGSPPLASSSASPPKASKDDDERAFTGSMQNFRIDSNGALADQIIC